MGLPFQVNEHWLAAMEEYKAAQKAMFENLRNSIVGTYKQYQPGASEKQLESYLANKELRKGLIARWRDMSIHQMKSEKLLFWEQYRIRSLNFHTLSQDLQAIEQLFNVADSGVAESMKIREYVIAKSGDTILEFANAASEIRPVLRFRVSSHILAEQSPLFAHMFSPSGSEREAPLDLIADLPPPPARHTCKDKMEVKVYRMPQVELNNNEALTKLLHAAHNHKPEDGRGDIEFSTFVSIAEVCLRYRCIPVQLEMQVHYQWLPQWMHMASEESEGQDGLLLISYVFRIRGLFNRVTKSAILNIVDEADIDRNSLWPQIARERIKAVRAAKLAQIHACCTNAIEEYFRPPQDNTDRRPTSVGSLTFSSVPRCPRGSHQCDATNLGWLMLVYNELRVLPSIMNNVGFHGLPRPPQRSLKELIDCLRLMPSAPQVHTGVCDYAPAFRSAINDISNSISGLTLNEVGRPKPSIIDDDPVEDDYIEVVELPATDLRSVPVSANEAICLKIMSQLDDILDLSSAAMIDRGFYGVYKRNEAALLRNVMKAERRRTLSIASPDIMRFRDSFRGSLAPTSPTQKSGRSIDLELRSITPDDVQSRQDDLYDASPLCSPANPEETPMSREEAQKILWPDDMINPKRTPTPHLNGQPVEPNEKYLMGDVVHIEKIEDKTMSREGNKHLRDEQDKALGIGSKKANGQSGN